MLTLHYYPGACSTAAHIALEEAGARFDLSLIDLPQGGQRADSFQKLNPRGQVPVLEIDGVAITETSAILVYIGRQFPEARLLPDAPVDEARCFAIMAWISSQVDPVFRRLARPERVAKEESTRADVKQVAQELYWTKCQELDNLLEGKQWLMGSQYTVSDPLALVYYGWALRFRLPVLQLPHFTDLARRLTARPAARRALEREQHPLLKLT